MLVAQIAQTLQAGIGQRADAAFALHGFDDDRRDLVAGGGVQRVMIAEIQMRETGQQRAEALGHLFRPRRRDPRARPPVERSGEGDDLRPLGLAFVIPVFARHLDGQFTGLGARVGKENRIRKGLFHQHIGQLLLRGNVVKIGHMPQRLRLRRQRLDQCGVSVAQRIDGDPCAKIQKAAPVCLRQPRPGP